MASSPPPPDPDPTPVLARIAAGDDHAVRDCVARFGPLVWSLARRWSPDAADAEDAVQEIFFDLWRTAARYDAAQSTEAGFVAMVARRRLIDRHRQRTRRVQPEAMTEDFDLPDERSDDSERVSNAMEAAEILARLTPQQRRFLERHLLDGKTHEEIAREAAVPLGTVKSHIHRGLKKARALFAGRAALELEVGE